MKNRISMVQGVLLLMFLQGCWATETKNSNDIKTTEFQSGASSPFKKEINFVLGDGEKINFPKDCEDFQEVIKGCQGLLYQYLGDQWGIDIHEITVSAPESDSHIEKFLIHGKSKSVMGGFTSARISESKKRILTSSGHDLYWFPHIFEIYEITPGGFNLIFGHNFENYAPGSKAKSWIGNISWAGDDRIIFELSDNQEKKTGEVFYIELKDGKWVISDVKSPDLNPMMNHL